MQMREAQTRLLRCAGATKSDMLGRAKSRWPRTAIVPPRQLLEPKLTPQKAPPPAGVHPPQTAHDCPTLSPGYDGEALNEGCA